ncbi:MAG TPA: metallophosphoesterase [candidate division Zixibacteria bacterium]|nr:metallophosphoesterase [candidate division Zixibacteria bacterium]
MITVLLLGLVVNAAEKQPTIRFAVLGDRTNTANDSAYGLAVTEIERLKPDFVMTVGDHIEGYTEDSTRIITEWEEYLKVIEPLTMPIHFAPGNHDITTRPMEPFFRRFAAEPYYSFDYEGRHFVILDNTPGGGGPAEPIDEKQMAWLENDLSSQTPETQILVFYHKPNWYETVTLGKPDAMHDLFVKYGVDAVFTGHYHVYFTAVLDGIKYTSVGSSGGNMSPGPTGIGYHFCWVTVSDRIDVTPIELGAVRAWDDVSAEDYRTATLIEEEAIQPGQWLMLGDDGGIGEGRFSMQIINMNHETAYADSLRWSGLDSDGWMIEPAVVYVSIPPAETATVWFEAELKGSPYPLPKLWGSFISAPDQTIKASGLPRLVKEAYCIPVAQPPVVDGSLDEACWQKPTTKLLGPDDKPATIDPTSFYFAYDDNNIYVGVQCTDPYPDSIQARITERDGAIYGEDCVGFLFHPGTDSVTHIYFNPIGTIYDQKITFMEGRSYNTDKSFNGDYEVKIAEGSNGWTLEARIPLNEIGGEKPEKGTVWDITFRRKEKRLDSSGDWMPYDYYPRNFGLLRFE